MKRTSLVSIVAVTGIGFFAGSAWLAKAATFPSPRLIYVAAGVVDWSNSTPDIGTTVTCMNHSAKAATVRWKFVTRTGANAGSLTKTVPAGTTIGVGTYSGTVTYYDDDSVDTAIDFSGSVLIYSTQSAVFCTAMVAAASSGEDSGTSLHLVRFNSHPGTVE